MSQPFIIEFAGLPAAGKTTLAGSLERLLRDTGLTVDALAEPGLRSPLKHAKRSWYFNAWTLCQTIASILEGTSARHSDVLILDRGLVDALAWITWFAKLGTLSSEAADAAFRFAQADAWFSLERVIFVLFARYETASVRRHQLRPGRIVNPATMVQLAEAYRDVVATLRAQKSALAIHTVDTDSLAVEEVLDLVRGALPGYAGQNSSVQGVVHR